MQFVDLSVPLENDHPWAPWWLRNHVSHQSHRFGRLAVWWLFRVTPRYLRTGLGWAHERLVISTHGTTHLVPPGIMLPPQKGGLPRRSTTSPWSGVLATA